MLLFPRIQSTKAWELVQEVFGEGYYPHFLRLNRITDIAQDINVAQMREDNGKILMKDYMNQRDVVSGVDINDEAAKMLVFEQMFQAMAKYLEQVQKTIFAIMDII